VVTGVAAPSGDPSMGNADSNGSIRRSVVDDFPGEALSEGMGHRCERRLPRHGSHPPAISAAFILYSAFARFGARNSRRTCFCMALRKVRRDAAGASFSDLR